MAFILAQVPVSLQAQSSQPPAQAPVPDAPAPQAPAPMSDVKSQITPGLGSQETEANPAPSPATSSTSDPDNAPPQATRPTQPPADDVQKTPPIIPPTNTGPEAITTIIRSYTNAVEVPVTVKDSKGHLVPGLTYRDFRIFENNQPQRIQVFSVDPYPLSVAFVIDQSLTEDTMAKVNDSLGSIQGALTPYDEVALFSYNGPSPKELTGFTGAQSKRLEAVLALNKATGREELVPVTGGALAGCSITANGSCVDPNLQVGHSAGGMEMNPVKEIHALNDAILRAATELSTRPSGHRRIIYVVSDGKEYGSKATTKEVIKYLQTNKIEVYATLVGDSARWGEGYVSRFHIPFQMNDNVLPRYTQATGGSLDAEKGVNGIEKSYQHIAEEARTQYTIVYYSHEPFIDNKYRAIDVRVDRPSKEIEVTAKPGYYPSAQDVR
ncbi:VWA domain-containing protein [Acidicapsa acidisoli]|uniref:VWA domain-containing protein n=1 Tax=Acidicapsa acidisoli TaxID=1615681 RepID=UPI0021E08F15|nr:VWA domain-containing protein [Acidicapsa acidisoli]